MVWPLDVLKRLNAEACDKHAAEPPPVHEYLDLRISQYTDGTPRCHAVNNPKYQTSGRTEREAIGAFVVLYMLTNPGRSLTISSVTYPDRE